MSNKGLPINIKALKRLLDKKDRKVLARKSNVSVSMIEKLAAGQLERTSLATMTALVNALNKGIPDGSAYGFTLKPVKEIKVEDLFLKE